MLPLTVNPTVMNTMSIRPRWYLTVTSEEAACPRTYALG